MTLKTKTFTGEQLKQQIIDLAKLCGWRVAHFRPAWTNKGFRTPITGDAGFPDLVLVRNGELVLWECKGEKELLTTGQIEWLAELRACHSVEARVVRPADWDYIEKVLK